jgi:hypothetical protein
MSPGLRLFVIAAGLIITAYGLYALYSGSVISTWWQLAHRPSVIYWITVAALLLVGVANVVFGLRR